MEQKVICPKCGYKQQVFQGKLVSHNYNIPGMTIGAQSVKCAGSGTKVSNS